MNLFQTIVKRTLRVPTSTATPGYASGNGETVARQLDAALMKAGFKLSQELLSRLGKLHPVDAKSIAADVIAAVQELVGDDKKHNVYFKDFPDNVPDTMEFWLGCIADALCDPRSSSLVALELSFGAVNLYDLPKYGSYQHSYEEMLAAHEQFMPSVKDRMTILHLGKSLPEEVHELYLSLAESAIPLNESDRALLHNLAEVCLSDPQPEKIPVRENKAVINLVRLNSGYPLLVDTPTDTLRLACALSGGDVALAEKTKFKSLSKKVRRALMQALDGVIEKSSAKLADVNQYREQWKRLGERLHPHEFGKLPHAQDVFAVARGDKMARSFAANVELAFGEKNIAKAVSLLANAPGMLFRSLDRVMRLASPADVEALMD